MAEHWKSAPRYWCKQCKIFIRDTAFEKTQHEASPKHQGNLKRFLRDIHRNNENQQRETQRAKSEVERLRKAVSGESQSKGSASASAPAKRAAPADKPVSAEERKKQMAQLVEMGVAIPEEYRAEMALAGEWQTLSETKVDPGEGAKSIGVRKRKIEGEEDDEGDEIPEIVSRGWGSRMKTYPGAQAEDDDGDLDALLASTKELKPKTESSTAESQETKMKPEISFKIEGDNTDSKASTAPQDTDGPTLIKPEEAGEEAVPSSTDPSTNPPGDEGAGVVFKKRKTKVMRK